MPRPSLKAERREQILDAYAACVARHGVEGATLERVAEEAGLARALIRHNVGNREDLLEALVARVRERSTRDLDALKAMLPRENRSETMVRWLFDPEGVEQTETRIGDALLTAAARDPALAEAMRDWVTAFQEWIAAILRDDFPNADAEVVDQVAVGIVGLYFSVETVAGLGGMEAFMVRTRDAALSLITGLN